MKVRQFTPAIDHAIAESRIVLMTYKVEDVLRAELMLEA
jgi:hypothetical protein